MSDTPDKPKKKNDFSTNGGINRKGRPKGSKNKVTSVKDFNDAVASRTLEAIDTLVGIMRKGSENNKLKASVKLIDQYYTVERDKVKDTIEIKKGVSKTPEGNTPEKKTNTFEPVLVLDMAKKA